jgi:hypothetical protein
MAKRTSACLAFTQGVSLRVISAGFTRSSRHSSSQRQPEGPFADRHSLHCGGGYERRPGGVYHSSYFWGCRWFTKYFTSCFSGMLSTKFSTY